MRRMTQCSLKVEDDLYHLLTTDILMTVVFDGPIQGIFLNAKNNYHISFLWQFKDNIPVPHSYMF